MDFQAEWSDSDFLALIDEAGKGNESAAGALFARYGSHVQRVIRGKLRTALIRKQVDSADLCQSVFAEFFLRLRLSQYEFAKPSDLIALISKMAANKVSGVKRRYFAAKRDIRREISIETESQIYGVKESTPSEQVAQAELVEMVRIRLSPEERYLAEQRALKRSWDELGEELGISAAAVRVRFARAIDRVIQSLDLFCGDDV